MALTRGVLHFVDVPVERERVRSIVRVQEGVNLLGTGVVPWVMKHHEHLHRVGANVAPAVLHNGVDGGSLPLDWVSCVVVRDTLMCGSERITTVGINSNLER